MLQIQELLEMNLFNTFHIISGESGLSNELSNVVILEYESINQNFNDFYEGDFVLTSLFFAKDHPELIPYAFSNLMNRKVSGIAIKTVFFHDIPESMKELSNQLHIPIFTFHDTYMEDLIICANDLLKSKQEYLVYEGKIKSLIQTTPPPYLVSSVANEINPRFSQYLISTYMTHIDPNNHAFLTSFFNNLLYKRYKAFTNPQYSFIKYQNGLLLLYNSPTSDINLSTLLPSILSSVGLSMDDFIIGISDVFHNLEDFHLMIKQSIYANKIGKLTKDKSFHYRNIGIYQYILPLLDDQNLMNHYNLLIATIKEYDSKYTSNLLDTLIEYVHNNGEITKTAKALYQHPNTIRYRLQRTKELLSPLEQAKDFYEQMYLLIKIYELTQS